MGNTTVTRYHDISCGHRVVGHEGHCAFLHGHNYRIFITCKGIRNDTIGRVIDFSVLKEKVFAYIEKTIDHRFLVWRDDPLKEKLQDISPMSIVVVDFNPTAENIAEWIVEKIGPFTLRGTSVRIISCTVEETRKCSATYSL